MFAKILVFTALLNIVTCSERHYSKHTPQHESHKEYQLPYEHRIPVQESASEEYKPENQHAYSSQSVVHQGQTIAYEESNEANADHETPLYQYQVDEQDQEAPVHHNAPAQHNYRPAHYPEHEIQTLRIPAHHKTYFQAHKAHKPAYTEPGVTHKVPVYYQPEPQEVQSHKDHYQPEVSYHGQHHAQENSHESHDEPIDYYAYPKYQYEYKVEDPHTGDHKFQHEIRDGDVVKGVYGLHEADGSFRTVEYSSDKHHGFSAIVKHSAPGQHVHIESHHQKDEIEH